MARVVFLGMGEPFCHPQIWDLIDACGHRMVSITTNGLLLDYDRLRLYKNVSLNISHYGPEQDKILAVCRHYGIKANLNVLLLPGKTYGKAGMFLHPICFDEKTRHYDDVGGWEQLQPTLCGNQVPPIAPTRHACVDPWFTIRVMANGNIYPCTHSSVIPGGYPERYLDHTMRVPGEKYVMGNVSQGILRVWYGRKYRRHRRFLRAVECPGKEITNKELVKLRKSTDNKPGFAYCEACLVRWGKSC